MKHCMCCLTKKKDKDSNKTLFTQGKKKDETKNDQTKKTTKCPLMSCCMKHDEQIPMEELGPKL